MNKWDWINNSTAPGSADLDVAEEEAMKGDTVLHRIVCRLVSRVRTLQHEINDPNYNYAGSRIHRQAIVCRNAQIEELREQLKQLKEAKV